MTIHVPKLPRGYTWHFKHRVRFGHEEVVAKIKRFKVWTVVSEHNFPEVWGIKRAMEKAIERAFFKFSCPRYTQKDVDSLFEVEQ